MAHVADKRFEKIKTYFVLINFFQQFFLFRIIRIYSEDGQDTNKIKYDAAVLRYACRITNASVVK